MPKCLIPRRAADWRRQFCCRQCRRQLGQIERRSLCRSHGCGRDGRQCFLVFGGCGDAQSCLLDLVGTALAQTGNRCRIVLLICNIGRCRFAAQIGFACMCIGGVG
ncbi:hypothetical protein ACFS07_22445 [Undibacterium arcticum]